MSFFQNASYVYMGVIVPLSILLPLALAATRYKLLPFELKILCWYLCLSGFTNLLTSVLAFYKVNNMPLLHLYTIVEFLILSYFYKKLLAGTSVGKYIQPVSAVFIAASIVNILFFQDLYTYNSNTKSAESLVIVFFTLCYFKRLLDEPGKAAVAKGSVVYANSGLLIYFSGSFLLFAVYNALISNYGLAYFIWNLHATFLMGMYMLFAVALWKHKS